MIIELCCDRHSVSRRWSLWGEPFPRQKINSLLLDAVHSQLSFVLRGFVLETEPFLTTRREADYRRSMSCNTNHTVGAAERRACMVIVSTSVPKISKIKLDRLRLTGSPRCDRTAEMGVWPEERQRAEGDTEESIQMGTNG